MNFGGYINQQLCWHNPWIEIQSEITFACYVSALCPLNSLCIWFTVNTQKQKSSSTQLYVACVSHGAYVPDGVKINATSPAPGSWKKLLPATFRKEDGGVKSYIIQKDEVQ